MPISSGTPRILDTPPSDTFSPRERLFPQLVSPVTGQTEINLPRLKRNAAMVVNQEPARKSGPFMAGIRSGIQNVKATFNGFAAVVADEVFDSPELKDVFVRNMNTALDKSSKEMEPFAVKRLFEAEPSELGNLAIAFLGQQVPFAVEAFATALTGGVAVVGAKTVLRKILSKAARKQALNEIEKKTLGVAIKQAMTSKAFKYGAASGAASEALYQGVGEGFSETGSTTAALKNAVPFAMAELIGEAAPLLGFTQAARKLGRIPRAAATGAVGAAAEATTEFLQTRGTQKLLAQENIFFDPNSPEAKEERLQAAFGGAVGGGVLGGVGGISQAKSTDIAETASSIPEVEEQKLLGPGQEDRFNLSRAQEAEKRKFISTARAQRMPEAKKAPQKLKPEEFERVVRAVTNTEELSTEEQQLLDQFFAIPERPEFRLEDVERIVANQLGVDELTKQERQLVRRMVITQLLGVEAVKEIPQTAPRSPFEQVPQQPKPPAPFEDLRRKKKTPEPSITEEVPLPEAPTEALPQAPTEALPQAPTEALPQAPTEALPEAPTEAPKPSSKIREQNQTLFKPGSKTFIYDRDSEVFYTFNGQRIASLSEISNALLEKKTKLTPLNAIVYFDKLGLENAKAFRDFIRSSEFQQFASPDKVIKKPIRKKQARKPKTVVPKPATRSPADIIIQRSPAEKIAALKNRPLYQTERIDTYQPGKVRFDVNLNTGEINRTMYQPGPAIKFETASNVTDLVSMEADLRGDTDSPKFSKAVRELTKAAQELGLEDAKDLQQFIQSERFQKAVRAVKANQSFVTVEAIPLSRREVAADQNPKRWMTIQRDYLVNAAKNAIRKPPAEQNIVIYSPAGTRYVIPNDKFYLEKFIKDVEKYLKPSDVARGKLQPLPSINQSITRLKKTYPDVREVGSDTFDNFPLSYGEAIKLSDDAKIPPTSTVDSMNEVADTVVEKSLTEELKNSKDVPRC